MKNKTKKILAGLGIGVLGMGCLTGCTNLGFSAEQVEKVESIIESGDAFMKDCLDIMDEMKESNSSFQNSLLEEFQNQDKDQLYEELLEELFIYFCI